MSTSKITIITGLKYNTIETTEPFGSVNVRSFSLGWLNKYPNIALTKDARPPIEEDRFTEYTISGQRITTPNGKEVLLGNAPEVEEFLGLQFDFVENLKKEKEKALSRLEEEKARSTHLYNHLKRLQRKLTDAETMSFLRRLKFLFTGELV